MNIRLLSGSLISYSYTAWLGRFPNHFVRKAMLGLWLGRLGAGTSVQMGCRFMNGRKVHLGERNMINFGCVFDGRRHEIRTGNDVSIGPEATILTLGHDPQSPDFADRGGDVIIGDRVWIAYRALILPGVTIGDSAVIAAGAVVARDVGPFEIVAGVPAKPVGLRNKELTYRLSYKPLIG